MPLEAGTGAVPACRAKCPSVGNRWAPAVWPMMIAAVTVPPLPWARRSTYRKVRDRAAFSFAVVSVAAAVDVADGVVRDCRS